MAEIEEKDRYAMKATSQLSEQTRTIDGNPAGDAAAEEMLWCPAVLPDGTQGHWFSPSQGTPFVCRDPTCPSYGQLVYGCSLHRGSLGQANASCTAANCGKEMGSNETLHRQS